jgi:predicted  nucleic acid-binding Zn-ribbon protein
LKSDSQVQALREEIIQLQAEVKTARDQINSLTESHLASSKKFREVADADRETWQGERASLEEVVKQKDELLSTHITELTKASNRLAELETTVAGSSGLSTEIEALRKTKQTSEARIADLEIEILELKEEFDKAEEQRVAASDALRKLENDITGQKQTFEETLSELTTKHTQATQLFDDTRQSHSEELHILDAARTELLRDLQEAKEALGKMKDAYDASLKSSVDLESAHALSIQKLQKDHSSQVSELNIQLKVRLRRHSLRPLLMLFSI